MGRSSRGSDYYADVDYSGERQERGSKKGKKERGQRKKEKGKRKKE
jgi:hypothetical protein